MRNTTHTITVLLFFIPISAGSNYTLSLFLIQRFKSLRNVSNITIELPDFPSICFNIHSELKDEYLLFHINFKTINKTLKEFSWKLITSY
jgi:predicted CDP-diglyceride synthetase/phosphatidate cytidylyltransferase